MFVIEGRTMFAILFTIFMYLELLKGKVELLWVKNYKQLNI